MRLFKLLLITWSLSVNAGLPPLPSVSGQSGKFLTNNGVKMSWGSASGTIVAAPGTVLTLAAATCPTGTLLADGSAISRTTYSDLFASIGTTHGSGNGTTTFNLPDYRGRFLRGVDGTANRDPDKASRTAMATGGNTGNAVGSVQADQYKSHRHTLTVNGFNTGGGGSATSGQLTGTASDGTSTSNTTSMADSGGNETRPINANVIYCVVTTSLATATTGYAPGRQVFTSSGTFTIPTGVTSVKVTVVGGGGGGTGNNSGGSDTTKSGGGGGTAIKTFTGLTPGATLTVTVGAGGSGTSSFTSSGGNGGTSSVSSGTQTITTVSATGGSGGGTGTVSATSPVRGGAGGAGSGGDINVSGSQAGWSGVGVGQGGSSLFGEGSPYGNTAQATGVFCTGIGSGYGAGGGGCFSGSTTGAGGSGTSGVVMFEW